ncbi:MAG: hypothetical protein AAFU80_24400 [Pseudomonadota bacterium]
MLRENANQSVELVGDAPARTYRAVALAPDPCHRISEEAEVSVDASAVVVTRAMTREPGICATVITPIEVTGPVPDRGAEIATFTLRLRDERGATVFEASAPL